MKTDNIRELLEQSATVFGLNRKAEAALVDLDALEASDREARVADFHRACGLPVASEPTIGDPDQRMLRVRHILEEAFEFAEAAGVVVYLGEREVEAREFVFDAFATADLAKMTHELADVQYVTSGTAVELGLPLPEAFSEIHGANMRKVGPDGKVVMVNGKVMKPEGWKPADVAHLLKKP